MFIEQKKESVKYFSEIQYNSSVNFRLVEKENHGRETLDQLLLVLGL